jgi:hypothetical protein
MKKTLTALALAWGLAGTAFGGSSGIVLTAPVVTSITISGTTYTGSALNALNTDIASSFQSIQNSLNSTYFNQLHDMTDLSRGFANANTAAFDNASLLGYQTYDLFGVMVGMNLTMAVPSLDPAQATAALNNVATNGDVYAGTSTGGAAAQLGVNLGRLVPGLYGTVKAGFVPSLTINGASFEQGMFGVGVNYTLVPQYDFFYGFLKWRGVSVGTGVTVTGTSTSVDIPVRDYSTPISASVGGQTVSGTASTSNTVARLLVTDSSVVVPVEIMSSVQALWFLNFGLGVGCDLAFSGAQVKLSGDSDLVLSGISDAAITPGSMVVNATDSNAIGDIFVPRIAASIGLDVTVFKLDIPMSFYPLSNAFSIGFSGGVVW